MQKASILVVEDESIVATDIRLTLESMGYEVCGVAAEGERAVELAAINRPDVVLMDIVLRGEMDGIRAAREIDDRLGIPSVFLTAYSDSHFVERAASSVPSYYILKPWDDRQLRVNIEMALARARAGRQWPSDPHPLFDCLPVPYQSLDADGRFLDVNGAWLDLMGYPREAVIGRDFADFLPAEGRAPFAEGFAAFKALGVVSGHEFDLLRSDGHRLPGLFNGRVQRDAGGRFVRTHCILMDLTRFRAMADDLRRAKEAAEEANRAKTSFLASFSHELRTPLNSILGFSEIIADEILGPVGSARYREYARDIHDSGTHLLELIDDILDLSKIEVGRFEIVEERLELSQAVRAVGRMLRRKMDDKGLKLDLSGSVRPTWVRADGRAMRQMMLNLIGNAIKFTPPGGRIAIAVTPESGGGVRVAVTDTGIGISAADMPRVFEPFRRGRERSVREQVGTGLGLAVVKSLIELHGGRVDLESRPGQGTTIALVFPAARVILSEVTSADE